MSHTRILLIIVCSLIAAFLSPNAAAQSDNDLSTERWLNELRMKSSSEIMTEAAGYSRDDSQIERALLCYTTVADRYSPSLSKSAKLECVEALNNKFSIYNYSLFDPNRAYESLCEASEIVNSNKLISSHLDLNCGIYYQNAYTNTGDMAYLHKALASYSKAFDRALEQKEDDILNEVFINLIPLAIGLNEADSQRHRIESYRSYHSSDSVAHSFNILLCDGLRAMKQKDWKTSEHLYLDYLANTPDKPLYLNHRMNSFLQLSRLADRQGDMKRALSYLDSVLNLAKRSNQTSWVIATKKEIADLYFKAGDSVTGNAFLLEHLKMKDELMASRIATNVRTVQLIENLGESNERITKLSTEKRWLTKIVIIITLLSIAAIAFGILYWHRGIALKRLNASLYAQIRQRMADSEKSAAPQPDTPDPDSPDSPDSDGEEKDDNAKRSENSDQRDLKSLWTRLSAILEQSDEIYNTDFTIARLAKIANTNVKYASMAINQYTGMSFPTLLGNLRIKEACRRIVKSENLDSVSIDMLAFGVGIRSRTTFSTSFRRVTGMTAAEFLRQTKSERTQNKSD